MLRATITKFKRAYVLAGVPRILRGDFQIPPCNFDKISPIAISNYKNASTRSDDEDKCEKCKRLIEAAFGPDKPPEESSTGPIIPDSEIVAFKKGIADKDTERNDNLAESSIVNATTPEEGDEKLIQKLEKIEEPPLVDAEQRQANELINNSRAVWFSDRDICMASSKLRADINILDELAKRCINAPKDKIDSKLLEEMEKLGVLQPCSQECLNVPVVEEEIVQMGCPKTSQNYKKKKENEIELEIRILEKNSIKRPRRYIVNRRAMRRLAMNLENRNISGINLSAAPQNFEGEHVIQPVNNNTELLNSTQIVIEEEKQNKAVQEKVLDPFMNMEQNDLREVVKYLYEERIQQDSLKQNGRTPMETPAVILSELFADVDDLKIISDIPKGEFVTGQTAINSEKKDSPVTSCITTVRYKHAGQSEMDIGLEEIRMVFDEEKVPLHPFVDLTNSGIERISQKTKSQDLESGLDLLQSGYPLNDIITEKIECQTVPHTNVDTETSTSKVSTDSTMPAETTNLRSTGDISKISSAMVQLSNAVTESAISKEDLKSRVEESHLEESQLEAVGASQCNTEELNQFEEEATDPQPPEATERTELNPKDSDLPLTEMLRRVRQRSLYETYEQIMFTSQVPEVEPFAGKPPCTPLATPPPKSLPPRPCPTPPKKVKKDKKSPCSKFQRSTTLHNLGLIVIRAPNMELPRHYGFPQELNTDGISKASTVMLVSEGMGSIVEDMKKLKNSSNRILSKRVLNFIRDYEPWDSPFLLIASEQRKK